MASLSSGDTLSNRVSLFLGCGLDGTWIDNPPDPELALLSATDTGRRWRIILTEEEGMGISSCTDGGSVACASTFGTGVLERLRIELRSWAAAGERGGGGSYSNLRSPGDPGPLGSRLLLGKKKQHKRKIDSM
eukprot:TRINITY_DN21812_c0_g2_i2.p2 TRINITY_DN21812_c0_g2~~TRINITY_DN21812_c0_g2_i2.p2  ORF type:complete len:133 (-),score=10.79 TRINITY_DN21812_c0_g2_i2:49-447(-)